jgi:hypothetical protein
MRSGFILTALLLALTASPASAVDLPIWPGDGTFFGQPMVAGPAITADGTIVFAVGTSRTKLTIERLAPGASAPAPVGDIAVPERRAPNQDWFYAEFTAAGSGFFVAQTVVDPPIHCCYAGSYTASPAPA